MTDPTPVDVLATVRTTRDRWALLAQASTDPAWAFRVRSALDAIDEALATGDATRCILAVTGWAARLTEGRVPR